MKPILNSLPRSRFFKLLIFLLTIFDPARIFAEGEPGRYLDSIFPVINVTNNITYAQNKDLNGQTVELKFDIYQPATDTQARRPLIIYMHGGSFQSGARTDAEAVEFCRYFAKLGYVTVSPSYRLGISNPLDPVAYAEAIYRAVQDARSVVRYLKSNASQYRLDTSRVYIGGGSAGSIAAIHAAYLQPQLVPSFINQDSLGGLDAGGNTGFSSKVHGVVNAFGAIMDTTWITAAGAPIVSIHGEKDQVVPFKFVGFGQFSLFGSYYIHQRALNVGIRSVLQSFPDTEHGFLPEDTGKVDTSIRVIRDFLYVLTTGKDTVTTTLTKQHISDYNLTIYPNPATDFINIIFNASTAERINSVCIYSVDCKEMVKYKAEAANGNLLHLQLTGLKPGLYILKFENRNGEILARKLSIR